MPELTDNQITDLRDLQNRCAALGGFVITVDLLYSLAKRCGM